MFKINVSWSDINTIINLILAFFLLGYFFFDIGKYRLYKIIANQACNEIARMENCTNEEKIKSCKIKAYDNLTKDMRWKIEQFLQ